MNWRLEVDAGMDVRTIRYSGGTFWKCSRCGFWRQLAGVCYGVWKCIACWEDEVPGIILKAPHA